MTSGRDLGDHPDRGTGESGAAVLEFAIVAVLLFTLLFGIIQFGLLLSFEQDVTRAAAEGARAGAVAPRPVAEADARDATNEAVRAFGGRFNPAHAEPCDPIDGVVGLTCDIELLPSPCLVLDPAPGDTNPPPPCETIRVYIEWDQSTFPLYGHAPFINAILPDRIHAEATARINR